MFYIKCILVLSDQGHTCYYGSDSKKQDNSMEPQLIDRFGRKITSLRLSVTDRCNLRCIYCFPGHNVHFLPRSMIASFEEIVYMVTLLAEMGVNKVRLTGGEPLVRKNVLELVQKLSNIEKIDHLVLTTNGTYLEQYAASLKHSGLHRVNVSLDSLNPDTYRYLTRGGELKKVLNGITRANQEGLDPVKINVVLVKGINEHEINYMVDYARDNHLVVRFIEKMPFVSGGLEGVSNQYVKYILKDRLDAASGKEIMNTDANSSTGCTGASSSRESSPNCSYYQIRGSTGAVGFISPVTAPFCSACNRVRINSRGELLACINTKKGIELLPLIRRGLPAPEIKTIIRSEVYKKHLFHQGFTRDLAMNTLGG